MRRGLGCGECAWQNGLRRCGMYVPYMTIAEIEAKYPDQFVLI
jgi:hypothetical protein